MSGTSQRTGPTPLPKLLNEYDTLSVDFFDVAKIAPDVERLMDVGAAKDEWDLTDQQAEAVIDHFGSFDEASSWKHTREDLQEIPGIGPKTAEKMRPNWSTRLKWAIDMQEVGGGILAQYTDVNGVQRHPSEIDEHPEKSYDEPYWADWKHPPEDVDEEVV